MKAANRMKKALTGLVFIGLTAPGFAAPSDHQDEDVNASWQQKAILAPYQSQLESENKYDTIYIYQGVKDKTVEQAMDEQFDRLEHMMFVSTVVTDESGNPMIDADTGQQLVESDDC